MKLLNKILAVFLCCVLANAQGPNTFGALNTDNIWTGNQAFNGPWIDVTTVGVIKNATQTAAALNTAISTCAGRVLFFPAATYTFTTQITLNASCTFMGWDREAIIQKGYNSTSVAALVIAASHVSFIGLTYDGNQAGGFTGNCIQDNSANTDILIRDNLIENCSGNSLFFTAAAGTTAADHINIFDNTIVCGTGTAANFGALGFQQTIHDVKVRHNVLDCSNDTSTAGVGAIQGESQGLTTALTNFLIEGNTIITPNPASNLGWGIQFGAYNAYMSTDVIISHNHIFLGGDHTGGISVQQHSGLIVDHNDINANGHSPTYVGLELIALTGANVTGNVINYDVPNAGGGVPTGCVALSSFSSGTFVGNTCNGFGENAGVGIVVNITQIGQQAITACSEVGNVATFTITAAMSSAWSPGTSVFLTGNTPAGYNTGSTPVMIQNANYNRAAGTFSVLLPASGLAACTGFGNVQSSASNNVISNNTVNFPQGVFNALAGTRIGIWLRGTLTGGHTDNNLIANNTVNGTGLANETGVSVGGTGTDDSNIVALNNLNNLAVGVTVAAAATNAYIGPNRTVGVTTPFTDGGTLNLVNAGMPTTFGKLVACSAGLEGNTAALTDVTTATYNTPVVGGGTNHLLAGCRNGSWVTQ